MSHIPSSDAATRSQPAPRGTGPKILPLVQADVPFVAEPAYAARICAALEARTQQGIATYGEPLRAHNGRNPLIDAYQEALDLAQYLRQWLEETRGTPFTLEQYWLREHYDEVLRLCRRLCEMVDPPSAYDMEKKGA